MSSGRIAELDLERLLFRFLEQFLGVGLRAG